VLSRLDLRGSADLGGALSRPEEGIDATDDGALESVRAIIAAVRARGDDAVRELTERFDGCVFDADSSGLRVPVDEVRAALDTAAPELRAALGVGAQRIRE
jgi:histidinol dehydrogenase